MTPDPQLLTKQIIQGPLSVVGFTDTVRFNLQRGKIARIWGFSYGISNFTGVTTEYSLFVRKSRSSVRADTPQDNLWAVLQITFLNTNGRSIVTEKSIMFPKPHRTTGLTIQQHATTTTSSQGLLIIYYDIDDATEGELANTWEKSRGKKYDRRMLAP